ncbi:adenylate/guanylate cyclase domain-containing protein [Sinimarinibacterium sp. CAU 1509]|uniref:CHASE2 domain-containing protein n=1 Tax=Sinimarinibacterium sp. CAU 1509 TaxID=2562283 RepID=UPI0010AB843E|nr:adenylate/guanylate cyclase domain-containing protein [Sinimarinibacterium sp. CAU 1509]TJY61132.1 adenylate/guanylate cyclase domain-containing protein [Sinimarinibacterium sp. CAU 1509]
MQKRSLIRLGISVALFAVFVLHSGRWLPMRLLDLVEAFTYDTRILLTVPGTPDPRVVIVDLDERSLAAEGWPWPRYKFAKLVNQLFDRYGIAVLGFDVVFAEPDDGASRLWERLSSKEFADIPEIAARSEQIHAELDYDGQFAAALKGRSVVLPFFFKPTVHEDEPASTGELCAPLIDAQAARLYAVDFVQAAGAGGNVARLQQAAPNCGFFDNPLVDADGVYRRVPLLQAYDGAIYPSLALSVTRLAMGNPAVDLEFDPPDIRTSLHLERLRIGTLQVPVDDRVAVYVPYRGPNRTFRYISAVDVLRGTVADPAALSNAIVLVGTTAAGLLDLRSAPVGRVFTGVEVHANIVSGMLDGRIRQKAPYYAGIEVLLLLAVALTLAWAFSRLTAVFSAAVGLALVVAIVVLAFAMWSGARFIMPMGVPVAFTFLLFAAHLLYGYFIESRGKREISRLFGQYVPPELVEEMAARPEAISMDGESREMSVLFSDVRGFTSISEKMEARELAELMNRLLTKQTGVIQKHRGTIDKYMGDAVMAFWGAPLPDEAHALHAMTAALDMVRAVRELDAEFLARGWPVLRIGVGINSGKMNVGNMGSEFRMAYTVMGDAVNLGSRLEGLTRTYSVDVICSEFTRNAAPSDWSFREIDRVRVKGRAEPVTIYEPMGPKDALDPGVREDLARQRGAMQLYRAQRWEQAEVEFRRLRDGARSHPLYGLFLERIAWLRTHPPGADWDGAFTFTTK